MHTYGHKYVWYMCSQDSSEQAEKIQKIQEKTEVTKANANMKTHTYTHIHMYVEYVNEEAKTDESTE